MKQISKKSMFKKKGSKETGHWEGKYWCNCKERNYRYWLAKKRYANILDDFDEVMKDVATEELEKLPKDGATQVDHYVYGHPKRNETI